MKHLTPERVRRREELMLAQAKIRVARLKTNPSYVEKVSFLALADILEMFSRKKLTKEESETVLRVLLSSQKAMDAFNRILEAITWTRSTEGRFFLRFLERTEKAA